MGDLSIAKYLIEEFYGDRVTKRHSIPLIWHIEEGLFILNRYNASDSVKAAFCIHPMIQGDAELKDNLEDIMYSGFSNIDTIPLALEYRNIANQGLRGKTDPASINIPLDDVKLMLIADKLQNKFSFEQYAKKQHPEADSIDKYFHAWLVRLGVENDYDGIREELHHRRWMIQFNKLVKRES